MKKKIFSNIRQLNVLFETGYIKKSNLKLKQLAVAFFFHNLITYSFNESVLFDRGIIASSKSISSLSNR